MHRKITRLQAWLRHARSNLAIAAVLLGVVGVSINLPWRAAAQPDNSMNGNIIVVRADSGGYLGKRAARIRELRATGQRVELRGTCLSACTMYLSLPNACIAPNASFGFHGPSDHGSPLSSSSFEHWSQIMAEGYREPLRSWFMTEARYTIQGYFELSGAQLIRMGFQQC